MAEIKIETSAGTREGTRILRVSGPFTIESVDAFESVAEILNDPVIIIDLTEVPYMDSTALGAIVSLHRPSQSHQRQYAVVGASERLRTMFRIARVNDILVTYPPSMTRYRSCDLKPPGN